MNVLFVLPRMVSGGVERVTLNLIQKFVRDGIACRLALRRCSGELLDEAFSLAPIDEFAPRGMGQFVPGLSRVIRLRQPTHIVTAFADVAALTWLAMRLARSDARWVHGVHNTHAPISARPGRWGGLRYKVDRKLADFVYRRADAIVAVSEGVRAEIVEEFRIDPARVKTIYNPVVPDAELRDAPAASHTADQPFRIAAIGRLAHQKGFDVLIRAMAKVPQPWLLTIWGDGPERARLERLISDLNLGGVIRLCGYTSDPFAALRQSELFVLPSRYEGLGNTLVEALACQCQVVAADCPHGPKEILEGGKLGQLVPVDDAEAMACAVNRVMERQCYVSPKRLRDRAANFSCNASCAQWELLLRSS